MQISARADYAVRAMLYLAASESPTETAHTIADRQELPYKFLEAILGELRRAGLVRSQRGAIGGYTLTRPASQITVGDVLRAVDGPLAGVRGLRPEQAEYEGSAEHLQDVWIAARASVRRVVDELTLAEVVAGELPDHVRDLLDSPDAWTSRA